MLIIIGPTLPEQPLPKPENSAHDYITFGLPNSDVVWNIGESIEQVIERCSEKYGKPDIVMIWSVEYRPLPYGFEKLRIPKVAVLGDWNLGFRASKNIFGYFDLILTDKKGVDVLRKHGFRNVDWCPLFMDTGKRDVQEVKKDIDIAFIGNLNPDVQVERAKWLKRIAMLSEKYNVFIGGGMYGDKYWELMSRSKIVFNRSIRGEMNMRCFEALACKSLLFLEEENLEIKNFLKDKVHCILYNDKNLEELINYYLTHEDERRRIADEGHKKVKQILQEDALMRVEKLIGKWLPVINSEAGGKKKDDKPNEPNELNEKFKIIAHNIISWTNFPSELPSIADDVLAHLEDAKDSKMDAKILNFRGVTLALKGIYWNSREFLIKSALALRKSCEKDVTWAIPHFNLGKVLFILGDTDNAVQCFKNTVTLTKTLGSESVKELDIFLTQAYDFFRVELERLYWTYPDNEELRFNIAKLTLASSLEYLGDIFRRDKKASVNFYEASIIIKPENPHIRYKFAKALLESGEVKRAVDEFEAAYAHSPLHSIGYGYVKYFIKALSIARLLNRLREIKSELKLITKASPQLGENLKENA